MLDNLTEAAQNAITATNRFAREAGHVEIDGVDFLMGLVASGGIAAAVLADLGIRLDDLVRRDRAARPAEPAADPDLLPQFGDDVRTAIRESLQLVAKVGHDAVDTGHLLLALTFPRLSTVRDVLAEFGVTAEALRDAVTARHPAGQPLGPEGRPVGPHRVLVGWDMVWSGVPERLPTRATAVRGVLMLVSLYAALGAVMVGSASRPTRDLTAVFLLGVPSFASVIRAGLRPSRIARRVRAIRVLPGGRFAAPDSLAEVVTRRFGAMSVEIVVEDEIVKSRLKRHRHRAWIVIAAAHAVQPQVRRAIALHETAHLLRNDAVRYELTVLFALSLAEGGFVTLSFPGLAVGLAGALALQLAGRWPAELACDALAVRWAGGEGMEAWGRLSDRLFALPANRTAHRRIRRALLGWLTHPPLRWRLARARALTTRHPGALTAATVPGTADV